MKYKLLKSKFLVPLFYFIYGKKLTDKVEILLFRTLMRVIAYARDEKI